MQEFAKIEKFIFAMVQPNAQEWEAFVAVCHLKTLKKKELLLEEGKVCDFIVFVNSGVLREYSFQNGKEATLDFMSENQFVSDYQSFIAEVPSYQYLEALTDVELIVLKKDAINKLYDQFKVWERFGRLIIERIFCGVEEKRKNIIATSHEEQYRNFVSKYPNIIQQVPQYYIASYLGLTPEHLSRLRRKI